MCRSIRTLHNVSPPVTDEEVRAAARQFVRKISGFTQPSQGNARAFEDGIEEVAAATRRMLDRLVSGGAVRSREGEAAKAKERWEKRSARLREPAGS
jgi:hypothetical protein